MKLRLICICVIATLFGGCDMYDKKVYELGSAVQDGQLDDVKKLVAEGVDVNGCVGYEGCDRPLSFAARKGQLEVVKFLVEHGAKINIGSINAVYWAALHGKADVVHYLLSQGGRLVCDQGGLTSLKRDMTHAGWTELQAEVEKTWVTP